MPMNIKIIAVIFGVVAFGSLAYFGFVNKAGVVNNKQAQSLPFDFGDAPDGKTNFSYPSLLESNGARTQKTDEVWLGQSVNTETDSKQVNKDEVDDGVKLDLSSCSKSTAYFYVRVKNPGATQGTAYINLYADWNKDGKWGGSDQCATEWAVRNFPIDLGKQTVEIAVYAPEFTAGKNVEEIWYRGAVTVDEQMAETATGDYQSGEVEDYGPKLPGEEKYYNFYCNPDPLKIRHGEKGEFKILPDLFSEPINSVSFGQNFQQLNFVRKATLSDNVVTYESSEKDVDLPKRNDVHFVDLKVGFAEGASVEKSCTVIVEHDQSTIKTPSGKSQPKPSGSPTIKTESGGSTKTEEQSPHPTPASEPQIQEGAPGLMKY